ncbi:hypothetical protein AAGX11_14095, partial [Staphylococcus aureus]
LTRLPVTQEIAGSIPVETVQMPIQEDRHFFAFNIILIKDISGWDINQCSMLYEVILAVVLTDKN